MNSNFTMTAKDSLEITILSDNYVDKPMLVAEHGFSCFIEYNGLNILFDMGQGFSLKNNFIKLCKNKKVDFAVLSHGHYDHSDGLKDFDILTLDIYAHSKIFTEHVRKNEDSFEFIGVDKGIKGDKRYNFILNDDLVEIKKDIFLSGSIKRGKEFDVDKNLYLKKGDSILKDNFPDEQYLVIKTKKGGVIFTGCSHCGVENIIEDVKLKFNNMKIFAIIGGFHLFRSDIPTIKSIGNTLLNWDFEKIITGHCTGLNGYYILREMLGEKVILSKVGLKTKII